MLGLPTSTEVNKQLPKKAIYEKFNLNTKEKQKIDNEISKITIVNEVSPKSINVDAGVNCDSFFVLLVELKNKDFDSNSIMFLNKLIPKNILFVLKYNEDAKLCLYHLKLFQGEWNNIANLAINLKGLNLDEIWDNVVASIANVEISHNGLDDSITRQLKLNQILDKIEKLTCKMNREKQPNKKHAIYKEIEILKESVGEFE